MVWSVGGSSVECRCEEEEEEEEKEEEEEEGEKERRKREDYLTKRVSAPSSSSYEN